MPGIEPDIVMPGMSMSAMDPPDMRMAVEGEVVAGISPVASTFTGRTKGTDAAAGLAGLSRESVVSAEGAEQPAHNAPTAAKARKWESMTPHVTRVEG